MLYKYAVAVVLYNPDNDAIKRIAENYKFFSQILLLDNTDNNPSFNISALSELNIIYHAMKENVGMSGALNYAYSWAIKNEIDYLLTMDQDTDFPANEIQKIINTIESNKYPDSALFSSNFRKIYKHGSKIAYGPWKHGEENTLSIMAMTSGTFYNIHKLQKHLPLPNLFIGMVDDDISYELLRDGNFGIMVGSAKLSQRVGETVEDSFFNKLLHKVVLSPERYYYMGRNSEFLLEKYKNESAILRRIKRIRLRIIGNIILCEKQKLKKMKMWLAGINEIKSGQLKLGKCEYRC